MNNLDQIMDILIRIKRHYFSLILWRLHITIRDKNLKMIKTNVNSNKI
jgi:hypothetical protein